VNDRFQSQDITFRANPEVAFSRDSAGVALVEAKVSFGAIPDLAPLGSIVRPFIAGGFAVVYSAELDTIAGIDASAYNSAF
jgi:hypothetical protein